MSTRRRVVITGLGVVTPIGNDVATFFANLLEGRSGVSFIDMFPTDKLRSDIAASVKDFDPLKFLSRKESEIYGRVTHFTIGACAEALEMAKIAPIPRPVKGQSEEETEAIATAHAKLDSLEDGLDRSRIGCLFSTGMGSVDIFEQEVAKSAARGPRAVSPFFIPGVMPNGGAALVTMRYGLQGPSYSMASACATGAHSISTCAMMIEAGDVDVMVAGGAEAATRQNCVAGFGNARALARAFEGDPTRASRPFDKKRTGFVMGEGAGALVLEEEQHALQRGAKPLAYVAGFGMTSDAAHLTSPLPDGSGLALAMERAIARAGITAADIGYINPHATSTTQGDVAEFRALTRVFGERLPRIPISATKSMIGHLLGGAAAAEAIAVVCSLRDQRVHPSINLDEIDPIFTLDLVRGGPRALDFRYAIKESAGFGGHNCAIVFERYPSA